MLGRNMKKILYMMGIDWYWIKQRPQILALELDKDYSVTVVYLKEIFQRIELRKDRDEVNDCRAITAIPFRDKLKIASWIEHCCFRRAVKNIEEYDFLWLGHPAFYKYIDKDYKGTVLYDCMDDYSALSTDSRITRELQRLEDALVKRADIIFVSSCVLKENVERIGGKGKTWLIRNGFPAEEIHEPQQAVKKNRYKIGYFGTVAEWMDFNLIYDSLEKNKNIEYHFIGPMGVEKPKENDRIIFEGVVEHRELYEKTKDYDAYIMPFQVNDVVRAVDPVKLYEYISMGKCVISVRYKEIERFSPFVHFYKDEEEYVRVIKRLSKEGFPPKFDKKEQLEFLNNNSWDERYKIIRNIMKNRTKTLNNV